MTTTNQALARTQSGIATRRRKVRIRWVLGTIPGGLGTETAYAPNGSEPPELLRAALASERQAGKAFAAAWPQALMEALRSACTADERAAWAEALEGTRSA